MSRRHLRLLDCSVCRKSYKQHILRQIHISSDGILRVNRCDHDLISKHELILNMGRDPIIRIFKCQRLEHHVVRQGSLHVLAVYIWKQPVTDTDHIPEILYMLKLIALLISCPLTRMVTHKRCEHAECEPSEKKVSGCVASKSAEIRTRIQETAHIHGRKHLDVEQDV